MDFKDKVALITGAATGLGRAISQELLKLGCKVVLCDLDSDAGEHTFDEFAKKFGSERVLFCHSDVTDYSQYEEAFQTTISEFERIDIVVNNAEIMNDKFWELQIDVNLNGVIRGTLLAQQFMDKSKGGRGGVVINLGSSSSVRPQISTPVYTATKHAILGFSRACGDAYHYNLTGVKVVAVCPSLMENEASSKSNRFKSQTHEKAWQIDIQGLVPQKLDHVAKNVCSLIKDAKSGTAWLIANQKNAVEIPYSSINL